MRTWESVQSVVGGGREVARKPLVLRRSIPRGRISGARVGEHLGRRWGGEGRIMRYLFQFGFSGFWIDEVI